MGKKTRAVMAAAAEREQSFDKLFRRDKAARASAPPPPPLEAEFAKYSRFFVREPSSYVKRIKSSDRGRLLDDMASHLLRLHPVPVPLAGVWREEGSRHNPAFPEPRLLHAVAASGGSLFKALGGALTRRETHLLCTCKKKLPFHRAAFLCVCLAAGATESGALAVALSKIAEKPPTPAWKRVAAVLSLDPPEGGRHAVDDIADHLAARILRRPSDELPSRLASRPALERAEEDWRRELSAMKIMGNVSWPGSPVENASFEAPGADAGSTIVWTLSQITDAKTLAAEGAAMRHCVLSYRGACVSGRSSIWSLCKSASFAPAKRAVTIEVDNASGRIVQARGLANRAPRPDEIRALSILCSRTGFSYSTSTW